ncbi:hypothetical protein BJX64DRAFT_264494 [Aspergillus heterothallicus]
MWSDDPASCGVRTKRPPVPPPHLPPGAPSTRFGSYAFLPSRGRGFRCQSGTHFSSRLSQAHLETARNTAHLRAAEPLLWLYTCTCRYALLFLLFYLGIYLSQKP